MKYKITVPGKSDYVIDMDIPHSVRNIGAMFSGGVDSTLILTLLRLEQKNKNFKLHAFTVENNIGYQWHCRNILKQDFFSDIEYTDNISNDGRFDGVIKRGIHSVYMLPYLDLLYTGVNQNPPIAIEGSPQRISLSEVEKFPKLRCPLVETTKDFIIQSFFQIPEVRELNLLSLTHSCTSLSRGHCGQCFQCKERVWAFKQIGQEIVYDN